MKTNTATIMDYLDWRGDIPFSDDPFNEVDNLILALLSYVDLAGAADMRPGRPGDTGAGETAEHKGKETETALMGGDLTLEQISRLFFQKHPMEEVMTWHPYTRGPVLLMEKAAASPRFCGTRVWNPVRRTEKERDEQFGAVTFIPDDGSLYVSFQGTDSSITGWKEDFKLAYVSGTASQRHAALYLKDAAGQYPGPIRTGGHSKGGNMAIFAAAFSGENVQERITDIYSNDSPGFLPQVTYTEQYTAILSRIRSIIPEQSVFGLLMENHIPHMIVKSTEKGILQHDAMSWQVLGNRFCRADGLSDFSQMIDKTLRDWLSGISPEEREEFVETVFDVLNTTGADTFDELNKQKVKNYAGIVRTVMAMNKEKRARVLDIMGSLMKSGKDVLGSELRERTQKVRNQLKKLQQRPADTGVNNTEESEDDICPNERKSERQPGRQ